MASLTIDNELSEKAENVLKKMGYNLKDCIDWFLKELVKENQKDEARHNRLMNHFKTRMEEMKKNNEEPWYKDDDELVGYIKEIRKERYAKK
ncbi:MAG: hypothetical protein J6M62_08305 [Selenomonadaceae bacterium]|nr:hypothetical protein [Selenomonadaceae bacterium]MBO6305060.1 hypothetical protein [Selenomonadaceae bacterium]MBP3721997.1 hypothetical protein [Selenomonadaceae bacterium]